jgi:VPDSG-CTERM motif
MKNKWTMMAGVAVALLGVSTTVQAVPYLQLSDNNGHTTGQIIASGGTAAYVGALGNWTVNIAGGIQTGTGSSPILDLSDNSLFSNDPLKQAGNQLTVIWYVDSLGPLSGSFINNIGGTENGVTDVFSVILNGTQIGGTLTGNTAAFALSQTSAITAAGNGNYIELEAVLTAGSGGQSSFDDHFNSVPDGGATVMLLGAALSVMGLFRKKLIA